MVRSREHSNRNAGQRIVCAEAGRRLEAVKPAHQLLKTAFKKREISRRCGRTISMQYVDKAMSGNEFSDRCRRLTPLMFRSAPGTVLSGGTTRVSGNEMATAISVPIPPRC